MTTIRAYFRGQLGKFELNVDFSIPDKGITALFGPSGCGKTSVLRCIAGLQHMPNGHFSLHDQTWQDEGSFVPAHKRSVGYVFQEARLFPHLSIRDNLLYGHKRRRTKENLTGFEETVRLLALEDMLERSPQKLSGGERQRVAIGRTLLSAPQILLMDEPLAALDRFARRDILPFIERLHDDLDIPILYVSHDLGEIERLADHMVLMGKGSVRASGRLHTLLADPELPFSRQPDASSIVEGVVSAFDEKYGLSTLKVSGVELLFPGRAGRSGTTKRLRINASDVALCRSRAPEGSSILNGPLVHIVDAREDGPYKMIIFLSLGEQPGGAPLLARITRQSWDRLGFKQGDLVHALIKSVALT